ncbi:MAG: hypothetical protein LBL75_04145 [Rickettsiales bacterium]|jgi:hypothetical protein|nr:hypothetical protein [Rickettsiales bacterium]
MSSVKDIEKICDAMKSLLVYKNIEYGDSALTPLGIFAKSGATDAIAVRLDDKLARVKHSPTLRKNDIADLIGYLVLLCADQGWTSFEEFKD